MFLGWMSVARNHLDIWMTKQILQSYDVAAVFDETGRKGMTQIIQAKMLNFAPGDGSGVSGLQGSHRLSSRIGRKQIFNFKIFHSLFENIWNTADHRAGLVRFVAARCRCPKKQPLHFSGKARFTALQNKV